MDDNFDNMTSYFGDSSVLNAVACLLSKQQNVSKVQDERMSPNSSILVLTNTQKKDAMESYVTNGIGQTTNSNSSNENYVFAQSLEQVHALATANLVASTQRDIAQQLAEAISPSLPKSGLDSNKRQTKGLTPNKKKEAKSVKKGEDNKKDSPPEVELGTEPKALVCSFEGCDRKFAWLTHLKYHELTHTNNRQFECPDEKCGKMFFTAQMLNVHLRTHTGEKPFKCTYEDCGKTFSTAGNLKNHERIHTGEQPFVCDFSGCNRRFTEYSSLRKHKLTHSGDKPFECKICNKKFTQSGSRRQHLKRHHLDEEIRNSLKCRRLKRIASNKEGKDKIGSTEMRDIKPRMVNGSNSTDTTVPNPAQVVVLNNGYTSHPTSESVVFSHGLSEQMVTVSSANHPHHFNESSSLSLSHPLFNTGGLHEKALDVKSDELLVLSQTPIYSQENQVRDIVYSTDILSHEDVTNVDYHVSTQVDACEEIVPPEDYHHLQADRTIQTDVSLHPSGSSHPCDIYQSHEDFINQHPPGAYAEVKGDIASNYLISDGEVLHEEFIGEKEVTIPSSSGGLVEVPEVDLSVDHSFMPDKESVTPLLEWDEQLHKH